MKSIFLAKAEGYIPNIGFLILGVNQDSDSVSEYLRVPPFKPFPYLKRRYDKALSDGLINNTIYEKLLLGDEDSSKDFVYQETTDISKTEVLNLLKNKYLDFIELESDLKGIINTLEINGFYIIKKAL